MDLLSVVGKASNDMYAVDVSTAASGAVVNGILIILAIFLVITYILVSYLLSRIFKKAGVATWKAWVPVYSTWSTLELGGQPGWIALLPLTPALISLLPVSPGAETVIIVLLVIAFLTWIVTATFLYLAMYKISLHFGKDGYFVLWAIFLPIVWYAWLAFDQSTWKKSAVTAKFHHTDPSV